jgi:hypothetical protein
MRENTRSRGTPAKRTKKANVVKKINEPIGQEAPISAGYVEKRGFFQLRYRKVPIFNWLSKKVIFITL